MSSNYSRNNKILKLSIGIMISLIIIALTCVICKMYGIFPFNKSNTTSKLSAPGNAVESSAESDFPDYSNNNDSQTPDNEGYSHEYVYDVESEVKNIRELYYYTQDHLTEYSTQELNGCIFYIDGNSEIVRKDYDISDTGYHAQLYYDNDNLYFAFIFNGTIENRFYIYNDSIFRWIDEDGIIHDNDYDNAMLQEWYKVIFK
ncbi:MAG: hypothetical protein II998_01295 [Clostridia bacterium]|nr:hypothetical protein [Clostridia bacterium]